MKFKFKNEVVNREGFRFVSKDGIYETTNAKEIEVLESNGFKAETTKAKKK